MRVWTLVALCTLAACKGDDSPDDTAGDDTGDSVDDSSDASGDTSEGDDTSETDDSSEPEDSTPLEPCLFHHGIHSGNSRWDYRWTQSIRVGVRYVTVQDYNPARNTATLVLTESWTQTTGGVDYNGTTREQVMCDETGLYVLGREATSSLVISGTPDNDTVVWTFSQPALVRPNQPVGGTVWQSREVGTRVTNGGAPESFDVTSMWGVTREDQRYNETWQSTTRIEGPPPSSPQYHWVHEVGRIESANEWVLTSHTP